MNVTINLPKKEVEQEASDAVKVQEMLTEYEIEDSAGYVWIAEALKEVSRKLEEIEAKRKTITKPLTAAKKAVDDLFSPVTKPLAATIEALRIKVVGYVELRELEQSELLQEKDLDRETLTAVWEELEVPKVPGVSTKTVWTGEVEDEDLIPRAFMIPNIKRLEELTSGPNQDPKIPGWRAYPKVTLRVEKNK